MIPVIGFAGPSGAGKNTAARLTIQMCGGYPYAFADPLRAMLEAGFGESLAGDQWELKKSEEIQWLGKTWRQLIQSLGTEWGRQLVSEDIWCRLANQAYQRNGPGMVISDVRFDNEAEWVRSTGGVVIHLSREVKKIPWHVSEAGVRRDLINAYIINDGSIDDLATAILMAVKQRRKAA